MRLRSCEPQGARTSEKHTTNVARAEMSADNSTFSQGLKMTYLVLAKEGKGWHPSRWLVQPQRKIKLHVGIVGDNETSLSLILL